MNIAQKFRHLACSLEVGGSTRHPHICWKEKLLHAQKIMKNNADKWRRKMELCSRWHGLPSASTFLLQKMATTQHNSNLAPKFCDTKFWSVLGRLRTKSSCRNIQNTSCISYFSTEESYWTRFGPIYHSTAASACVSEGRWQPSSLLRVLPAAESLEQNPTGFNSMGRAKQRGCCLGTSVAHQFPSFDHEDKVNLVARVVIGLKSITPMLDVRIVNDRKDASN